MRQDEYQKLAQRTDSTGRFKDAKRMNAVLGLLGECGEVIDVIKKWLFQSGDGAALPEDKLIEEIGDVLWYLAAYAEAEDLMLGQIIKDPVWSGENGAGLYSALDRKYVFLHACSLMITAIQITDDFTFMGKISMDSIARVLSWFANLARVSLEECAERNIAKLRKRYPDGFDPERSLNRDFE
jgi:NTP pyrophosphatase (non-canonical NTP hydrolase)